MIQEKLHQTILQNITKLESWFESKKYKNIPFYASFDLRDSHEKISIVDANLFPGGFHLTCKTDLNESYSLIKKYFNSSVKTVGLICETPPVTSFYWENICTLEHMINEAGFKTYVLPVDKKDRPIEFKIASGRKVNLSVYEIKDSKVYVDGTVLDKVITNSDFSASHPVWSEIEIDPPYMMGWHQRNKVSFFKHFNKMLNEFCEINQLDPFLLSAKTESITSFNVKSEEDLNSLANKVERFLDELKKDYKDISYEPSVFIKNASGTYGMGVTKISSHTDILNMNRKTKDQFVKSKGGSLVHSLIIQEAIPSSIKAEDITAEPVIYMLGDELMGSFLRAHSKKGAVDNLNSPGAVYKTLCLSDLKINLDKPLENIYGWLSKIGFLALCEEMNEIKNYSK